MRLYIIRHADPDYGNNTITAGGHLEAKALAKRLKNHGIDHIYCSPMGRAKDTMQYTAKLLDMEAITLEWTKELSQLKVSNSPWDYQAAWDIPAEIILNEQRFPTHETWDRLSYLQDIDVKETFEQIKRNSDDFLKQHGYERKGYKYHCPSPTEEKIAVFCHGGFGLTWLAHLLQIPLTLVWAGFWMPPSSVTTILFDQRSEEWAVPRCIGFGDVSHLYEANLPVKPRGVKANFY